jgi:N-acetylneuraminic acid mutarotase
MRRVNLLQNAKEYEQNHTFKIQPSKINLFHLKASNIFNHSIKIKWITSILLFSNICIFLQSQEIQQVAPFFLPKTVNAVNKYYVLTQGYSDFMQKKYKINGIEPTDTAIVIYEFFPARGIFKKVTTAPFVRSLYGAAFSDGKIIVAGGYDAKGNITNTIFEYSIIGNVWKERKPGMIKGRVDFALESSGLKLFALYGDKNMSIELFDDASNKWKIAEPRYVNGAKPYTKVTTSVLLDNKIYLFSGNLDIQTFDCNNLIVDKICKCPFDGDYYGSALFNRKIYISGCTTPENVDHSVYLFNTNDNSWKEAGKISVDLCGAGLIYYSSMLIFVGGSTTNIYKETNPLGSLFIYRPLY